MNTKSFKLFLASSVFLFALALSASPTATKAHENYVLTKTEIDADVSANSPGLLTALQSPSNMRVALSVGIMSLIGVILYFWFQSSRWGTAFDRALQKLEPLGHVTLRIALAASLIASAHFNAFLGPEIPLVSLPLGLIIKPVLYILGVLMIIGLWSEVVGAISLAILLLATWVYKDYMLTYFNYYGEFVALMLFGSRIFSFDKVIYKIKEWAEKKQDWEIFLIRITYGVSVMYPAIIFKLLHPQVIVDIANRYNLMQFHWLFPHDPLLIALGAGLAQVVVGICLIVGFETRLNTFVTFALMTMSVLFFKEAVWPHYILLALALYLMINNGGKISLDHFLQKRKNTLKAKLLQKMA